MARKPAKELVDGAPKNFKEGVSKAEADDIAPERWSNKYHHLTRSFPFFLRCQIFK